MYSLSHPSLYPSISPSLYLSIFLSPSLYLPMEASHWVITIIAIIIQFLVLLRISGYCGVFFLSISGTSLFSSFSLILLSYFLGLRPLKNCRLVCFLLLSDYILISHYRCVISVYMPNLILDSFNPRPTGGSGQLGDHSPSSTIHAIDGNGYLHVFMCGCVFRVVAVCM